MSRITEKWRDHLPEYLMEAAGLGILMISVGLFTTLLEYPHSLVHQAIAHPLGRRALMGLAMGSTVAGVIYSPWGQRSGAHLNPALTLAFLWLGKVSRRDALFYVAAQISGGLGGVLLVMAVLGHRFAEHPVSFAITVPGRAGATAAFMAEMGISFGLMSVVLLTTNAPRLSRYTGLFVGMLLTTYIIAEAPLSGMSLNPARSFAPVLLSGRWAAAWVYFTAPLLGMSLAALVYRLAVGLAAVKCAKLNHHTTHRCIFNCDYRSESPPG